MDKKDLDDLRHAVRNAPDDGSDIKESNRESRKISITLIVIFVLLLGSCGGCIYLVSKDTKDTSWRTPTSGEWGPIGRNLVNRGCGEYYVKSNGNKEYKVKCIDGSGVVRYYLVWTAIDEVMGPYSSE